MNFFKYQSLGNDFILLDWMLENQNFVDQKLSDSNWSNFVRSSCDRHFGIGADGILILVNGAIPKALIYNSDGSNGEVCFNGIRCVASHLFTQHKFPKEFDVLMGKKKIHCKIDSLKDNVAQVITNVGKAISIEEKTIKIDEEIFNGYSVNVGNPHFIVFKTVSLDWLQKNGSKIETDPNFPNKTNVEFVWPQNVAENFYNMIVFERGCGITLACSSGAAAFVSLLHYKKDIEIENVVKIKMPGGFISSWLTADFDVFQSSSAAMVFKGIVS
ncbi:TPA: diaminopimelate epimerase [Candidatus Dependentiae bacterium]|nr:MAG: Diaminopimelate epimerase [candidate division TM6 bacterium GW2011_GWE2_31_21]KKP53735.1 MAG: Diaminopimelate epimerase [candidate division TM6 bacterium GW2011_GWF2_33_332]HBS48511.1 diaminopimelate epimerase [Candidatus Dependentiae bacterium]HBZ73126.1 diaminopimelate epimerase [Candidatus Dependentiae bacterium]